MTYANLASVSRPRYATLLLLVFVLPLCGCPAKETPEVAAPAATPPTVVGATSTKPIEELQWVRLTAKKYGGDLTKVPPEDRARVQRFFHGNIAGFRAMSK